MGLATTTARGGFFFKMFVSRDYESTKKVKKCFAPNIRSTGVTIKPAPISGPRPPHRPTGAVEKFGHVDHPFLEEKLELAFQKGPK